MVNMKDWVTKVRTNLLNELKSCKNKDCHSHTDNLHKKLCNHFLTFDWLLLFKERNIQMCLVCCGICFRFPNVNALDNTLVSHIEDVVSRFVRIGTVEKGQSKKIHKPHLGEFHVKRIAL